MVWFESHSYSAGTVTLNKQEGEAFIITFLPLTMQPSGSSPLPLLVQPPLTLWPKWVKWREVSAVSCCVSIINFNPPQKKHISTSANGIFRCFFWTVWNTYAVILVKFSPARRRCEEDRSACCCCFGWLVVVFLSLTNWKIFLRPIMMHHFHLTWTGDGAGVMCKCLLFAWHLYTSI